MTELKQLLELRTKIKEKKPHFIRQDYQRRKRLGRKLKWRKPKGIHSKIRHRFKGHRKMPSPGYKSPIKTKGLHATGFKITNIASLEEFKKINRETEGIVISKNVGNKKKLEILKKAKELDVKVLNLNADEHIKKIEDAKATKKEEPKKKKEIKKDGEIKEAKKETKTKEPTEKIPEKVSDEQKKEAEKKEKDRILIKKT